MSPLQVAWRGREALAAEVGLAELVALDHRAHRAVEDEDARRAASRWTELGRVDRRLIMGVLVGERGDDLEVRLAPLARRDLAAASTVEARLREQRAQRRRLEARDARGRSLR